MKRLLVVAFLVFVLFFSKAYSQSGNSNIGTEFWTGWMDHINPATGANACQMSLYIASDVATTGTVSLADGTYTGTFSVVPNVITIFPIPSSAFLSNTNGVINKGIHVVSKNPIAVYAHIYASSVSGATLLLPVNTLANDYYSLNYTQLSNQTPSYSVFMVIATVDNTVVQITPSAKLIDGSLPNVPFNVTLNKGQIYQGISTTDLTGTHIASVSNGATGCQKIAVFSGSNKIYIGAPKQTADNLFQQVYPTASWGKNYITVPLKDRNYDVFRIVVSDPTATVKLNGATLPATQLISNFYYEFKSQVTNVISADKPVQVIQYAVTQGNSINGVANNEPYGDPEMIYLNPLEQNIDHVTLYSANEYLIKKSYINVVLPTTAVSSFLLDGAVTTGSFITVPGNPAYAYAQFNVTSGATHNISAISGFNAIAYGFGSTESYGYAAGTNVKNLNEYVQQISTTTGKVSSSGCTGTAFIPEVVIPYQTTSITWDLGNGNTPVVQTAPVLKDTIHRNNTVLYVYDYVSPVTYNTAGAYPIKVTVVDPITTVCGSNEEIDLNYNVTDQPVASFSSRDSVCVNDTVGFTDKSNANGNSIASWRWTFGDGDTSIVQNPVHKYLTAGNFSVTLTSTNQTGCVSIFSKTVHVRKLPVAAFGFTSPDCETGAVTFTDKSSTAEGKIVRWIWDYGDGGKRDTSSNSNPVTHIYTKAGTDTVKLLTITDKGCYASSASRALVVHPKPKVDFNLPDVCLVNAIAQFTDKTTIADSSSTLFKYSWSFGDSYATVANPNTSTLKNPAHQYTKTGTYHITLTVTSKDTCTATVVKDFTVNGVAKFTCDTVSCPAAPVSFKNLTDTTGKIASAYHWDFGDKDTSVVQNPVHAYKLPGDYVALLSVTGHNGCSITTYSKSVHISKMPVSVFSYASPDCETHAVTFTDHSTSAEGKIVRWIWSYGDGTKADTSFNNNPITHIFAKAAIDTVKLQILTDKGCSSIYVSRPVTIHPQPKTDFSLPDVCLVNALAQFTDKTTIADSSSAKFKYLWNFGDSYATVSNPNTSVIKNPTHKFTQTGVYHVTLTVTSKDTCQFSTTKDFTVNGIAKFTCDTVACPATPVSFYDKTDLTGKLVNAYHWNFGDGDTSLVQNPTHAYKLPGNYTTVLTVTGHNGCSTTTYSKGVHINQIPVASYTYSKTDCAKQAITFTDHSTAAEGKIVQWRWAFNDGTADTLITNAAAFTHTFAKAGKYAVTLIATTNLGCASNITSQDVTVNPLPVVDFILPDVCEHDSYATFTAAATIANNSTLQYLWDFGDPANLSSPNSANGSVVKHSYKTKGTYHVKLTVTTADGCVADTVKQLTVNGSFPQAAFSVQNVNNLCSNNEVLFNNLASNPGFNNGSVTSVTMFYDYANHPADSVHYAHPGSILRHAYAVEHTSAKTYRVHMIAYSGATCFSTKDTVITLLPVPDFTFSQIAPLCQNGGVVALASYVNEPQSSPKGVATFIIDNKVSANGIFDPAVAGAGQHIVKCIYTANTTQCADTLSQTVEVEPAPTVSAGASQLILAGGQVTLKPTATGNNLVYQWSPATGLNKTNVPNPVASPMVDTWYKVTVVSTTNNVSCMVSDSVLIKVLQAPVVPSVFTPNGDGTNDTWVIQHLDSYPGCTIDVYNRNGAKVFSSIGYGIAWDGRYNGSLLPSGTYYYIIDPKHGRSKIAGSIAIIR